MNTIIEKIRTWVERQLKNTHDWLNGKGAKKGSPRYYEMRGRESAFDSVLSVLSDLEKEEKPIDLEEAAREYEGEHPINAYWEDGEYIEEMTPLNVAFIAGAQWQKEKLSIKDFPTTDEEMKQFLATHPKVELPEKYKTPDWMFEKSEKPSEGLEDILLEFYDEYDSNVENRPIIPRIYAEKLARRFYELSRQSKPIEGLEEESERLIETFDWGETNHLAEKELISATTRHFAQLGAEHLKK